MARIEKRELMVEDKAIHCEGCEGRIQDVLGRLPGVIKVNADHRTQTVNLTLDTDKTALDDVRQRLEAAGYRTG